jgi:hypothetical protein
MTECDQVYCARRKEREANEEIRSGNCDGLRIGLRPDGLRRRAGANEERGVDGVELYRKLCVNLVVQFGDCKY